MRFTVFLQFLKKLTLYLLWQFYRLCRWSWCRKLPHNVPFNDFLK